MIEWLKSLFAPPPMHDIWLDGIGAFVFRTENNGARITVSGWRDDHWKFERGHLVRFLRRDGDDVRPSTYRILEDKHCGDPPDMYFLECEYVGSQGTRG
jgi:hypothetical protein